MVALILSGTQGVNAQDEKVSDIYDEGTVWNITYVRTHANMESQYLIGLSKTWASAMEKFEEAGLIESYKILSGEASNDDDFNLMLMIEFKNFAMYDPDPVREAKFDEIEEQIQQEMGDKYDETLKLYPNIREILGTKTMREMEMK
jgi:hypothetical protein